MSRRKPETLLGMNIRVKKASAEAAANTADDVQDLLKPGVWLTGSMVQRMLGMTAAQFSRLVRDPAFGWIRTYRPRPNAHARYCRPDVERYLKERVSTIAEALA